MGKSFYLKMAFNNLKRNQKRLIPYFIAATIMISVYFMVIMIIYTPGMENVPESASLKMMFTVGCNILNIFIAIFMLYINSFLVKQRKKELGLYGILGLEKRHVGHIMLWENLLINGFAVLLGIVSGCVFGWLIFMLLMKSINVTPSSHFFLPPEAFTITLIYFCILFFAISVFNLIQVRVANPIDLLKSDHQGEKKSRFLAPITILGLLMLGYAYYLALKVDNPMAALQQFLLAVILVIFATYALFVSGSIFLLKSLKKNKKYYYKPDNFVSVAGMFHRMKQNAAGLASICILSTMVLVTVSTCVSLFLGQEDMLATECKDDIVVEVADNVTENQINQLDELFTKAADENEVKIENEYRYTSWDFLMLYDGGKFVFPSDDASYEQVIQKEVNIQLIPLSDFNRVCNKNETLKDNQIILLSNGKYEDLNKFTIQDGTKEKSFDIVSHLSDTVFSKGKNRSAEKEIYIVVKDSQVYKQIVSEKYSSGMKFILNINADQKNGYQYSEQISEEYKNITEGCSFDSIFSTRATYYSIYGGLLFMGAFFTILFLCATVLIIYFKQISEGYEDKDRFAMLQKVGMDDMEVKRTIDKQILMVFFLPLLGALLHLSIASHMIIKLLEVFMLYNVKLTILCMVGSCAVFTLAYVFVYRMTAKTYCRIVRW